MKTTHKLLGALVVVLALLALMNTDTFAGHSLPQVQQPTPIANGQSGSDELAAANPTPYPKVLPSGMRPFLNAKPNPASANANINSYFDHRLPVYGQETNPLLPGEIRDANGNLTWIFSGEERIPVENDSQDQGYAYYSGHNGVDFNISGDVTAPANGVIGFLFPNQNLPTNVCGVWIEHDASQPPDGQADYTTSYLHLSALGEAPAREQNRKDRACKTSKYWCGGDTIRQGEVIGKAGNVPCGGTSTGVHLHFGLAQGALTGSSNPRVLDPFGWWSNTTDPWADERISTALPTKTATISYWMWGMAANPAPGDTGYWGANISSQVDNIDPGFQKFGSLARNAKWTQILRKDTDNVHPIGTDAWRSVSIASESSTEKKNSAVWGLYVPAAGTYQVQVFIPKLPAGISAATQNAIYTVRFPLANDTFDIWDAQKVDQQRNNEWVTFKKANGTTDFSLRANSTLLVELDDITGKAGETVVFDAVRLKQISLTQPPSSNAIHRIGFAMDNSSSMVASGKIDAVKAAVPAWIDQISSGASLFQYAFSKFANNVLPSGVTEDAVTIKGWINSLNGNDNGIGNNECPEASLDTIIQLAPSVTNGDMLLFTDDVSFSPLTLSPKALMGLMSNHIRLHSIILPKTCWFDGTTTGDFAYYRFLSWATGGTYQEVTTDKTGDALKIVLSEMNANTQVGYRSVAPLNNLNANTTSGTYKVQVDSSLSKINFLLDVFSGAPLITVYRPDSSQVYPTDPGVTYIDSGAGMYYTITSPVTGEWTVVVVGGSGENSFRVTGESSLQFSYIGDTYGAIGKPIKLSVRLDGTVVTPTFSLEDTSGTFIENLNLQDAGMQGDYYANDGIFTGWYTPTAAGDFKVRTSGITNKGEPFNRTDSRLIRIRNVSVTAPASQMVAGGKTQTYTFQVSNNGDIQESYNLYTASGNNWLSGTPLSYINVPAHTSVDVAVKIAVPLSAVPNDIDIVHLTAVLSTDTSIVAEASTITIVPDVDKQNLPKPLYLPLLSR